MRTAYPALILALCVTGCGDDEDSEGGTPDACDVRVAPSDDDVTGVLEGLLELEPGQTLCLEAGTYEFDKGITFNGISDVTVRGAGKTRGDVVLDFAGQTIGDDAFTIDADRFTIENLTIKDPPGDGIKITKSDRPTFRNLHAYYSGGSLATNGAYALYPVESTNVLIEDCEVEGSSDAAIYLGQSTTGIVRRNKAHGAVIGVEVENSADIEVYENEAWDNTTGYLIVNLPSLPKKGTHRIKLYDNISRENNRENFGAAFAAGIPRGTGMIVMASNTTHVYGNQVSGHTGPGLFVGSWPLFAALGELTHNDPEYDMYANQAYVHGNTFTGNGQNPQDAYEALPITTIEDIVWDGTIDPGEAGATAKSILCVKDNGSATFRSFEDIPNLLEPAKHNTDVSKHDCTQPDLPPVNVTSE
ncbi:MAG TPA: parallel beta-helix domain-containing protein [Polyangiaceae bacterium]|nr:parallel beta-helix domain-containing protein [Polyangiaceae bacterium]